MVEFEWRVPWDGYRWIDAIGEEPRRRGVLRPAPQRFLTWSEGLARWRLTRPLEDAALFRNFAELETTEDPILAFADENGSLGRGEDIQFDREVGRGEGFQTWKNEIAVMHAAVRVGDALRARPSQRQGARSSLSSWFRLEPGSTMFANIVYTEWPEGITVRPFVQFVDMGDHHALRHWMDVGGDPTDVPMPAPDPETLAVSWLRGIVNLKLRDVCQTFLHDNERAQPLRLVTMPRSLLGAMWLQFARAIDGDREFRRCLGCNNWFEVTPGARRSAEKRRADATHCRNSCRVQSYRRKQRSRKKPTGKRKKSVKRTLVNKGAAMILSNSASPRSR